MTKYFVFALAIFSLAFSTPVATHASSIPNYKVVNTTSGLNLRDANCKKVGSIKYGELVTTPINKTVNCNISGKNTKMIKIEKVFGDAPAGETFVSSGYLSDLKMGSFDPAKTSVKVNAVGGLNLRDNNCKRVTGVINGTELKLPTGVGGSIKVCRAGNQFYSMTQVIYNGKNLYVADYFVK